jgi:hypothetical protein
MRPDAAAIAGRFTGVVFQPLPAVLYSYIHMFGRLVGAAGGGTHVARGDYLQGLLRFIEPWRPDGGYSFCRLFGLHNWIPYLHLVLLGFGLTWLVFVIGRAVIRGGQIFALLPGFLFLTFAFLPTMMDMHRWYSSMAVLAALAAVAKKRTRWGLVAAGVLSGLASFFTQTQGVFAVLGLQRFVLWEG